MSGEHEITPRVGVWILGALGGLATTTIVGSLGIRRKLAPRTGISTDARELSGLGLVDIPELRFGGHDVRQGTLAASALEIHESTGSIHPALVAAIEADLAEVDAEIRSGALLNPGRAIESLAEPSAAVDGDVPLKDLVGGIQADIERFRKAHSLERVIVVNLASTEPHLPLTDVHQTIGALRQAIDDDRRDEFRSSLIYSTAEIDLGCPYVNFTPSNAALVPAVVELAAERGVPFMGSDGKTGETLVKSALAPMFRHRALRVLTWQGYNILGDRDGQVLSDEENLASKVASKDHLVSQILGHPLHTHVGIDYVPSLGDLKTAWDFIHFEGFLGHRMSMQFIWQGCDAVLAAPLVLDLVRMIDFAARRGESGPMSPPRVLLQEPVRCR